MERVNHITSVRLPARVIVFKIDFTPNQMDFKTGFTQMQTQGAAIQHISKPHNYYSGMIKTNLIKTVSTLQLL